MSTRVSKRIRDKVNTAEWNAQVKLRCLENEARRKFVDKSELKKAQVTWEIARQAVEELPTLPEEREEERVFTDAWQFGLCLNCGESSDDHECCRDC